MLPFTYESQESHTHTQGDASQSHDSLDELNNLSYGVNALAEGFNKLANGPSGFITIAITTVLIEL